MSSSSSALNSILLIKDDYLWRWDFFSKWNILYKLRNQASFKLTGSTHSLDAGLKLSIMKSILLNELDTALMMPNIFYLQWNNLQLTTLSLHRDTFKELSWHLLLGCCGKLLFLHSLLVSHDMNCHVIRSNRGKL